MGLRYRQPNPWDVNSSSLGPTDPLTALLNQAPTASQATQLDASNPAAQGQGQTPIIPAGQGQSPSATLIPSTQKQSVLNENLGPVRRGINKSDEIKSDATQKALTQNNLLYTPEQLADTIKAWSNIPQFKDQQDDIDNQKKIFGLMAGQPSQVDLSPLSRLVDSWYGTKLSEGYKKPQTPQEKLAALAGYGNKLAGDQSQLTGNIIKAFGDSRAGMSTQLQQLMQTEMLKNAVGLGQQRPNNFEPQNFKSYNDFVSKEMGGDKATDSASELKNLYLLVQQNNNPTALREMPTRLDKFITGSARVSDSQIKALGGDPSVLNSLEQKLRATLGPDDFDDKGYLTAKNQQQYESMFQQYAAERNRMRALKAQYLSSPGQLSRRGLDPGAGKAAIPDSMVNIYSLPSGGTAPTDTGPVDPDAALKAAILKHLQDKQAKGK